MSEVNQRAIATLNSYRRKLTRQQYKTLRGQILNGNDEGAMKGLYRLVGGAKEKACPHIETPDCFC